MKQIVVHHERTDTPYTKANTSVFEFREQCGKVWLQKLCFKVLDWIGCYHLERHVATTYGPFENNKTLTNFVYRAFRDVREWEYYRDEWVLLIGGGTFQKLMDCPEVKGMLQFTVNVPVGSRYHGTRIYGMPVVVVPWMKGFVVVPKWS